MIRIPYITQNALGGSHIPNNTSRSLLLNRYAAPESKEEERKDWFTKLTTTSSERPINKTKEDKFDWLPNNTEKIYARLMSRLMVNLSGGVMENANLLLDRYGMPTIPGSAIKGCARRMALQALHDWVESGESQIPEDDACQPSCSPFKTPEQMLSAIATVFGWVETDWESKQKDGVWTSDFAWAVAGDSETLTRAKELAGVHDSFTGTVAFLPATPNNDPGLVVDVVTPHHTKYYEGAKEYENAPDTEDPVPVYFPAVNPQRDGDFFVFPLIPLVRTKDQTLSHAKLWLEQGLELMGLGAKTAAGYGWFEIQEEKEDLGDYENETIFTNRVLNLLSKPQEGQKLRKEVEIIQSNPVNEKWIPMLREHVRANKSAKKRLKTKDWFPNEWISSPQ